MPHVCTYMHGVYFAVIIMTPYSKHDGSWVQYVSRTASKDFQSLLSHHRTIDPRIPSHSFAWLIALHHTKPHPFNGIAAEGAG